MHFSVEIVKSSGAFYSKKFKCPLSTSSVESESQKVNRMCRDEWNVTGGSTKDIENFDVESFLSGAKYFFRGFVEPSFPGKQP